MHLWTSQNLPIFLGVSGIVVLVGIFSVFDLTVPDDVVYSDTWNSQIQEEPYVPPTGPSYSPPYANAPHANAPYASSSGSPHMGVAILEESLELSRAPSYQTDSVPDASKLGFAVGGAQDIDNFRLNIENNYLPLYTDITYEGLFYDYYFDTNKQQKCDKLFCPSYSYAVSKDPLSYNEEYYLSVGLNSGMKQSDFERKKLNLVVVLDISGSMNTPFNTYHYDQYGNQILEHKDGQSKIKIATESLAGLVDHLNHGDRLGVVLFNTDSHLSKPLESMEHTNKEQLKENIRQIYAVDGTNMAAGTSMGTSLFDNVIESDPFEYENRIIFLTDAMPNTGDISKEGLFGMIKNNAENKIYTSVIGIGVDFNTQLIEEIIKTKGANYYSVHSASDFKERMIDEFELMVTPLVFDLVLSVNAEGYKIKKVYGSPEADESTGEIIRVNTLFPSKVKDGQTKGGIVLLKLEKISPDGTIVLETSFEDRIGRMGGDSVTIELDNIDSEYFQNSGIRKGIVLARYAELMKTWAFDERMYYEQNIEPRPAFFYDDGIYLPEYVGNSLVQWERQSIPLRVSGEYQSIIGQFNDYFKREMVALDDYNLVQEIQMLDKLA